MDEKEAYQDREDPVGDHHQIPQVPPFQIKEQNVPNIGDMVFQYLDKESLLNCREVCKDFMMHVDTKTPLWTTKSLLKAVQDENLEENVRLEIVEKILHKKKFTWTTIQQRC